MKYGIYYAYWENSWSADQKSYISRVKKLGFDGLEIGCGALKKMTMKELTEMRDEAAGEGVILTGGYGPQAGENLGSSDPAVIKNAIGFYRDMLEKLAFLGIHTFGGGLYSYWPVDFSKPIDKERDWEQSVKNVRIVGKMAEDLGIDYCLESLNRFEGYLINTAEECLKFVNEVDVPAVKVMLDTFHMNIEEDSMVQAILTAGDKLGHFHVGENNRRVPGKGNMPWNEIGQALKMIGYDKNVVMEPFVRKGGEVGADIHIWREIIKDESLLDKDAANSVAYLRHVFE
ncbi:MAG: sugar phosphate isomerase/epimerase family protein [Lachnospiraceae bacterium]